MKLYLLSAAPALLLASTAAFAQAPAAGAPPPRAPAPAAAPSLDAPATAAAPASIADVPVAATPAAPPEMLPPMPPPTDLPTKLGISKDGFFQPGLLLQFWAFGANQAGDTVTTLRLRRAEIRVKGEIIPKTLGFNVMIDPARALEATKQNPTVTPATMPTSSVSVFQPAVNPNYDAPSGNLSILQDYNITFMSDYADVSLGQFKIPVSFEGYQGSSKIIFPERSIVSRRYGDLRDIGIKVEKKLGKNFYYFAGLFNGEGQNKLDSNAQKDAALRLEVYPIDGITVGAVGYAGIHNRTTSPTKDRLEGDFKLDLANLLIQAEYIHGWDGPTAVARAESAGVYAVVGYTIADKVQPLFRIGRYDPNVRGNANPGQHERGLSTTPDDELTSYEFGLNYFIRGNDAKLQASYSLFDFDQDLRRAEVILSAQAAY
jgi:hypothetical protein